MSAPDHSRDYPPAQRAYWDLSERYGRAILAIEDADGMVSDDDPRYLELTAARDALDAFSRDHDGETFRVFRPESIRAMINPNLKPLFPPEEPTP